MLSWLGSFVPKTSPHYVRQLPWITKKLNSLKDSCRGSRRSWIVWRSCKKDEKSQQRYTVDDEIDDCEWIWDDFTVLRSIRSIIGLFTIDIIVLGSRRPSKLTQIIFFCVCWLQKYKNFSFLEGILKVLFLQGLNKINSKYELRLCSSRLNVVLQVSYKFAYKWKVWAIIKWNVPAFVKYGS
jgi:hypothetical protein